MSDLQSRRTHKAWWADPMAVMAAIAVLVIVSGTSGYFFFQNVRDKQQAAAERVLVGNLNLALDSIQNWLFERNGDTNIVAQIVPTYLRSATSDFDRPAMEALLEAVAQQYRYGWVGVYSIDNKAKIGGSISAPDTISGFLPQLSLNDLRRPNLTFDFGGTQTNADRRQILFYRGLFTGPADQQPYALVVLSMRGSAVDSLLLNETTIRGWEGDVAIAGVVEDTIVFLDSKSIVRNQLTPAQRRVHNDGSVEFRIVKDDTAVQVGRDLAGATVIAAGRRIRPFRAYVIASITLETVFAELNRQARNVTVAAAIVGALLIGLGLLWRRGELYRFAYREANIQRRFDFALRHAPDAILLFDDQGMIIEFNDRTLALYGYNRDELLRMRGNDLRGPNAQWTISPIDQLSLDQEWTYETVHKRKDGSEFAVEVGITKFELRGRHYINAIVRDISERHRIETERRLAARVFTNSVDGIVVTDAGGKVVMANPAFCRMFGFEGDAVVGAGGATLLDIFGRAAQDDAILQSVVNFGAWQGEVTGWRRGGESFIVRVSLTAIFEPNGTASQLIASCNDLTLQNEAQQKIEYLSHFDALTDLPSRVKLIEDLEQQLTADGETAGCVLAVLSVDRLRLVNETLGYKVGDALLVEFSRRLVRSRADDRSVFRLSGSEFAMTFFGADIELLTEVVDRTANSLAQPFLVDGQALHLNAHVGTARSPGDGTDAVTLLLNAHAAMRAAQAEGQETWQAYSPEMNQANIENLVLEEELRGAIARGELALYFQPQLSLADGRIVGAEALLRWFHPTRGQISPARFIPIAEQSGLILDIGNWVLAETCRIWTGWSAVVRPPPVAVNISALQFQRQGFVQSIVNLLQRHTVPSSALQLELTESAIMGNAESAIAIMRQLAQIGIKIAIDDFGTGYSSLSYLQRFPVAKLKIDRSFVMRCDERTSDAAIIEAVIAMARSMDVRAIAEGVETESQRTVLVELGCDEIQGYLISAPVPAQQYFTMVLAEAGYREDQAL